MIQNAGPIGTMWLTNSATTQTVVFAAAACWTSTPVAIEMCTNVIEVFGTNVYGVQANDTVTVIGVPEPAAIMTGILILALHRPRRRQ